MRIKKKKTYQPKRTTFLSLILRGLLAAALICAAFEWAFRQYNLNQIRTQIESNMDGTFMTLQNQIGYIENNRDEQTRMKDISVKMCSRTWFEMYTYIPLPTELSIFYTDLVDSTYWRDQHALTALIDENNNIVASNRAMLFGAITVGDDRGVYFCDSRELDIPEVDELFAEIDELYSRRGEISTVDLTADSIYYDVSRKIFIPRTGRLTLKKAKTLRDLVLEEGTMTVDEEREINIDLDGMGFETMTGGGTDSSPFDAFLIGIPDSEFNRYGSDFEYQINEKGYVKDDSFYEKFDGNIHTLTRTQPVYIGGKTYQLFVKFVADENDPEFVKFNRKWVIVFSAVTLAVTLLLCWRKNVLNKAKYAFEDYQRDLTDSLAHDIKTPLMAISGYTENVLSGRLTDEEQKEYLTAILDNVSFTDRLISRTLYLNHAEKSKSKPEPIKLADMTEEMLGKYAPMLREKKITYGVNGNAEIKADKTAMETLMENLISNAVKYTPNGGTVKIEIDKKHLTITNSVTERINTKELKRPFVRGDQARSNADGNGLGLAIAERAALANGFKLTLSCTETEFKTELIRR